MRQSIPAGQNQVSAIDFINSLIQKELRQVLEHSNPNNQPEAIGKSINYYKSCLNRTSINAKSVKAMTMMIESMGGLMLTSKMNVSADWSLDSLLKNTTKYSLSSFFSVDVGADDKNVSTSIIQINQGGLGLGDGTRDYYVNKTVDKDPVMVAYAMMLQKYAELIVGESNVEMDEIYNVVRFEQALAMVQQSQAEMRDPNAIYNKVNVDWLQKNSNFINWFNYFESIFYYSGLFIPNTQPVLVYSTPYIEKIVKVVQQFLSTEQGKRTIQNYVVLMAINDYGSKLGDAFQAAYYNFQGVFAGTQGAPETWQICVTDTDAAIGFASGALYIDSYFTAKEKDKASSVIDSIISTFRTRVQNVCFHLQIICCS